MGTEVHCRTYFSEHNKMRDINADAGDDTWPSLYVNKAHNEHFRNGFFRSCLNGSSICDKEMLKRTILEHEAIFKKQVYELHRLYSIQKNLMEELQKNGFSGVFKNKVPLNTFSCSSQVHSIYSPRMQQMPHLYTINSSQQLKKERYNDEIISSINFLNQNPILSSDVLNTETLGRVSKSDRCFRESLKRKLDSRHPSADCIHDTERSEKVVLHGSLATSTNTFSKICSRDFDTNLRHNLVNATGPSGKSDAYKLDYFHKKNLFSAAVDLNEPTAQKTLEKASDSLSAEIFSIRTHKEERCSLPIPSTTLRLQNAFSKDKNCCERTFSNVFIGTKKEISNRICHNEVVTGEFLPVSYKKSTVDENLSFYDPVKVKLIHRSDIIPIDKASTRFGHDYDDFKNLGKASFSMPSSFSSSLELESNMTSLPMARMKSSKDDKLGRSPLSEFSNCDDFTGSFHTSQIGIDLNSPLSFGETFSSFSLNGLSDGLQKLSNSFLQRKLPIRDINLNVESESIFSGNQDGHLVHQSKATKCIDGKCESFFSAPNLFQRKPASESLEPSSLPALGNSRFSKISHAHGRKFKDVANFSSNNLEAILPSPAREHKIPNDCCNSLKFIAPNFNMLQKNLLSSLIEEKLVIDEIKLVGMSHDMKMCGSEKLASVVNDNKPHWKCIDLNSVSPLVDCSDSSDTSAKVHAVSPFIDMKAPILKLQEDNITTDIAYFPFSSCRMALQKDLCSYELCIKEAAENIIKLSLVDFKNKDDIHGSLSTAPLNSALHFLADMILLVDNSLELNAVGLDHFELMTMKLEEEKPESLWCKPREVRIAEVSKRSKASLLLAKPRRVLGKKRRQRKDFQKDILPALATLSRQESMKDLRTIGQSMAAAGLPWKIEIRKRKIRGAGSLASQKRQQRTAAQNCFSVGLLMADGETYGSPEADRHHMFGWGNSMRRRCRSQRCPPMCTSATLI